MASRPVLGLALVLCCAGCPRGSGATGPGAGGSVGGPAATPRELADQVVAALAAKAPDIEALSFTAADLKRGCPGLPPATVEEVARDDRDSRTEGYQRCAEAGDWTGAKVLIATGGAVEKTSTECPSVEVLDTIEIEVQLSSAQVLMTLTGLRVGGDVFKVGDGLECAVKAE